MKILLRAATIFDGQSALHGQQQHILIENGIISYIGPDEQPADQIIAADNLSVSAGWVDMYAVVGEPGIEYKEDLESLSAAAAAGGFTEVLCLPNTAPVVQSKASINFIKEKSKLLPVTLHPTGALTVDTEGRDLTEMIDLHRSGAVAFTDGTKPLQGADVLLKALQYLQTFNGLLLNRPEQQRLTEHGQMHEGLASTRLGMKGIPAMAEEVAVTRDLQLLAYTGGKLHFSLVSAAAAVAAIRQAKAAGLNVTCDVASYQLAFTDESMAPFDTNYKVSPPFRGETDNTAIRQGLADGTIDALVSGHVPQDTESKKLEFDLAEFGIINLETAFGVAHTTLRDSLGTAGIIEKLTANPRRILGLPAPRLAAGEAANLTLFDPDKVWVPAPEHTRSKSRNSPFFGQALTGSVIGIIHKGQVVLNPSF